MVSVCFHQARYTNSEIIKSTIKTIKEKDLFAHFDHCVNRSLSFKVKLEPTQNIF